MVGMLWLAIAVIFVYQYKHERDYRTDFVHDQLSSINNRVIQAYERDIDLNQYITFLGQWYDNSLFDELMVSVYNSNGHLIYCLGTAIPMNFTERDFVEDINRPGMGGKGTMRHSGRESIFYFQSKKSADGQVKIITAMPLTLGISNAIATDPMIWVIIVSLVIVSTLVAFYSTRFLSRNVTLLREFARKASKGMSGKVDIDSFPHDELGDISREIIAIYREKTKAIDKSNREHEVALHAMEEKSRIKRQLTNNINHELKTPIGVIRGYVDTILQDPSMPADLRTHFLERTQANVERLCALMKDVSTITRLEEGSTTIPVEDVNMHDVVYSIDSDFEASQLAPNMTFSYNVPLNCVVHGNESLINGMILNLIRNAGIHSHGTAMGLDVLSESDHYYTFVFWDNGRGVKEEHIPHLFERFYRIDEGRSRKGGGTGLGLPIVKSTVVSLGGAISIRNRSKGGLEIVFTLPKWDEESSKPTVVAKLGVNDAGGIED